PVHELDEADDVATHSPAVPFHTGVAAPALRVGVDVAVGVLSVVVKRTEADQGATAAAQLDTTAGHDVFDAVGSLDGFDVEAAVVLAHHAALPSARVAAASAASS